MLDIPPPKPFLELIPANPLIFVVVNLIENVGLIVLRMVPRVSRPNTQLTLNSLQSAELYIYILGHRLQRSSELGMIYIYIHMHKYIHIY